MKKQIILSGGLGNQMFQYAFYLSLMNRAVKCELNASMFLDIDIHQGFELERVFGIKGVRSNDSKLMRLWYRVLQKYCPTMFVCKDPIISYCPEIYNTKAKYYFGFWMNEAYFRDIADTVREEFVFQNIDEQNKQIAAKMKNEQSVSLHIRRGDYLKDNNYNVCTEKYYRKAIDTINGKIESPFYYVFSDDPGWCNSFMPQFGVDFQVITHNRGKDSYKDMYLMSNCHHNIIANSTFSWWGAWLNSNAEKMVVAPSPWWNMNEKSPVCEGWILVNGLEGIYE